MYLIGEDDRFNVLSFTQGGVRSFLAFLYQGMVIERT
jgi:hypothetical protein